MNAWRARRLVLLVLWLAGCLDSPEVRIEPAGAALVELGRHLFYDTRLSRNESQSCGTCHQQALAFTDGRARALGSTGQLHARGAPTLTNVARAVTLTWANPLLRDLETQALVPMFGERPVELGLVGVEDEVLARLAAEPRYPPLFAEAFPAAAEPIILRSVVRALAAFERTLIATASPYDAYLAGNERALTRSAQRGAQLFLSDRLGCAGCHSGPDLTDGAFHNTGLYDEDGGGAYPPDNLGLFEFTGEPADVGRFRTPTLRNVGVTAPYMHDGSEGTLDAVLDQYAAGGRTDSRYKSERLSAFVISAQERADVLSFLHSLTDEHFLSAEALSDPWR